MKAKRALIYLRDRLVNAYWMIRERRFRQAWNSLLQELRARKEQVRIAAAPPPMSPLQLAGGNNPCKPARASSRPVISRLRHGEVYTVADPVMLRELLDSMVAKGAPGSRSDEC